MPSRQPRWPSIGLNSCSASIFAPRPPRRRCRAPRATSRISSSPWGRNSCSGGSSRRIVTGRPVHRAEDPDEVAALHRQELRERALARGARRRRGSSRAPRGCGSASKNMCSVRQRPMPSAPNSRAILRVGRACRRWCARAAGACRSAQRISSAKAPASSGVTVGTRAEHHLAGRAVEGDRVARAHARGRRRAARRVA